MQKAVPSDFGASNGTVFSLSAKAGIARE